MAMYTGGCHCGRIRFEVDGQLDRVSICNCSICSKTGYLHWTVEPERLRLLTELGNWTTYRFLTRKAPRTDSARGAGCHPFAFPVRTPTRSR